MNAEIVAVGSELLTPQRLDTNSLYLTDQLNSLGVELVMKMVVGDDRRRLAEAVRAALSRSEIVIITGGLGPTEDDVTRDAVAQAIGRSQSFHQDICDWIEARFKRMNRVMVENNRRQAFVIDGAEILENDRGTAPGQWINEHGRIIMLLPGPPNELKAMFSAQCMPKLERLLPPQVIRTRFYRVAGMPESDLDQLIAPVYTKYENPATTILAAPSDIQFHLRARCADEASALAVLAEVGGEIEQLLGDRIYSTDGRPLEAAVGAMLARKNATLAVAESCTGGMLAERITSVAGSSNYFLGGFLTYTNRMKIEILGIDPAELEQHTAVSEFTAEAMARGAKERTGASYALSVTGVAGPDGGTEESPVGTVWIGLANATESQARRYRFLGDRERIRGLATQTALDLLRRKLGTAGS